MRLLIHFRLRSHTRQQQAGATPGAVGQQRTGRGREGGDIW